MINGNVKSSVCACPSVDCLICAYRQTSAQQFPLKTIVIHECLADLRLDPDGSGKLRPLRIDDFHSGSDECPLFLSLTQV